MNHDEIDEPQVASTESAYTSVERLPLDERARVYRQQLEQLSRALDDEDEPLDFDVEFDVAVTEGGQEPGDPLERDDQDA